MPCQDCSEIKKELAAQKAFMSRWFDMFLKQIQSVEKETQGFRREVLSKLHTVESLLNLNNQSELTSSPDRTEVGSDKIPVETTWKNDEFVVAAAGLDKQGLPCPCEDSSPGKKDSRPLPGSSFPSLPMDNFASFPASDESIFDSDSRSGGSYEPGLIKIEELEKSGDSVTVSVVAGPDVSSEFSALNLQRLGCSSGSTLNEETVASGINSQEYSAISPTAEELILEGGSRINGGTKRRITATCTTCNYTSFRNDHVTKHMVMRHNVRHKPKVILDYLEYKKVLKEKIEVCFGIMTMSRNEKKRCLFS